MTKRSIRLCQCGAPAAYGPWCFPCCSETDPEHMTFIAWDAPCEEPTVHPVCPVRSGL